MKATREQFTDSTTASEAIRIWEDQKEARRQSLEREDVRRLAKVLDFPESPQLCSLTESARICPGWNLQGCLNSNDGIGGDEPDPGQELCSADLRAEEKYYRDKAWIEDGNVIPEAYPHLFDGRADEIDNFEG